MQIIIVQITNGFTVTIRFPGKGDSTLAVANFESVIKELTNMAKTAKEQHEKEASSIMKGVHTPKPMSGP